MPNRSSVVKGIRLATSEKVHVVVERGSLGRLALMLWHSLDFAQRPCANVGGGSNGFQHEIPLLLADGCAAWSPRSAFLRSLKSSFGSLADKVAFKLSKSRHHVIEQSAQGGSGINAFGKAAQFNTAFIKHLDKLNQFFKGSAWRS